MMKRNLLYLGIIVTMFFISCNKPKVLCEITEPLPNATFDVGEVIKLSVLAEAENSAISEVQVYLDGIGYETKFFFPYNFRIRTDNLKEGTHTIRVIAIASGGLKSETTVSFNMVKYESPDFVSFSDGKIPKGWRIEKWEYDGWEYEASWRIHSPGFDDDYAIRATEFGELITRKTGNANINHIEFYAKNDTEWTSFRFRIGNSERVINLTNSWEKYSFEIPQGEHILAWTIYSYSGNSCQVFLDAIRFFKE